MDKHQVLQSSRLFANLLPDELDMLADLCQVKTYASGDIVFEEGEVGNALYVIGSGEVDVIRDFKTSSPKIIATLKALDFFGEMSLIDKEYRSASVKARTDTEMIYLSNENLHSFAKVYKNGFTMVVINIARVLSQRLRETNAKLAQRM
ncbi:MAG: hypothetical protein GMKNLPBB_01668 [Myxococcota bacterium]|nr:hypothetical protein [Myxococcota bacterium]